MKEEIMSQLPLWSEGWQ